MSRLSVFLKDLSFTPAVSKLIQGIGNFKSCVPTTSLHKSTKSVEAENSLRSFSPNVLVNVITVFHLYTVDTQDTANNVINFLQLPHKGFICTQGIKRL